LGSSAIGLEAVEILGILTRKILAHSRPCGSTTAPNIVTFPFDHERNIQ